MLILIGTVPTAYALNHAVGFNQVQDFVAVSQQATTTLDSYLQQNNVAAYTGGKERAVVEQYLASKNLTPDTLAATRVLMDDVRNDVSPFKTLASVPAAQQQNTRNDMYLTSEAFRLMKKQKNPAFAEDQAAVFSNYRNHLDSATKFIPTWVKVAVAMALGLGTMVGWKRIVVTVGEKIGKDHLTYAQGASAELVAMCTILAADNFGLPVSTTHVLSSGVAGTMMANKSGLQWSTIRNIALAWVFTLPMAALLSGSLFYILRGLIVK
jgi:PiT family inorganic phosphate transporter